MKNKGYAKFWGATKVHYWRCANSVFKQFGGKHGRDWKRSECATANKHENSIPNTHQMTNSIRN